MQLFFSPLEQFDISYYVVQKFYFTTLVLFFFFIIFSFIFLYLFFIGKLIPNVFQIVIEFIYKFILETLIQQAGRSSLFFFPFTFIIFFLY